MNPLPHLQELFEKLKTGYHVSHEDGLMHAALMKTPDEYAEYFGAIGLKLVKHERDFFYFESEDATSEYLPQVAVFCYVLIDHTANLGLPIEATLMGGTLSLRGLPHFTLDSYRAHLRQVDLLEPEKLRRVVSYLVRIGWAKWVSTDEFTFLRPFCRVFERCLELSEHSPDRADESAEGLSDIAGAEGGENA